MGLGQGDDRLSVDATRTLWIQWVKCRLAALGKLSSVEIARCALSTQQQTAMQLHPATQLSGAAAAGQLQQLPHAAVSVLLNDWWTGTMEPLAQAVLHACCC